MSRMALGMAAMAVLGAGPVAGKTKPTLCPQARYLVGGGPLLPGAPPSQKDVVTVAASPAGVSLSIGCGETNEKRPTKLKASKRATRIRAA